MAANVVGDTSGLVSIGELARAAGVSNRTIRYYEELGILPEPHRSPGGTRRYPREYRGYIDTALALKNLGFRLEEIKPLARLAIGRSVSPVQRETAARLVEERIEVLGRQVSVLRRLRDSVRGPDAAAAVPTVLSSADLAVVPALHSDPVPALHSDPVPARHSDPVPARHSDPVPAVPAAVMLPVHGYGMAAVRDGDGAA
jgi:DNA-binding transcriptional MerR regulator